MDLLASKEVKNGLAVALIGVGLYLVRKYCAGGVCRSKVQLDGKVVLITGANTGIGKEAAIDLGKRGAKVYIACRDPERGALAVQDIKKKSRNENIHLRILDLASFESIRSFTENFLREEPTLHILINNAGLAGCPNKKTRDGLEMTMGVNHYGHFLLTNLLLDVIKASSPSRIINVSSAAHQRGVIDFEDLGGEKVKEPFYLYSNSKLANILFTKELSNRLTGTGVSVFSLHPGTVVTEIWRDLFTGKSIVYRILVSILALFILPLMKNAKQGAQTTIFCAVEEGLESQTGEYFKDCKVKAPILPEQDHEVARKLWEVSENLVGLSG